MKSRDTMKAVWIIITVVFVSLIVLIRFFRPETAGMDILIILAIFILFYRCEFCRNGFFDDYISRKSTMAINGFFILLVFFTHAYQYINVTADNMPLFYFFRAHIRQLVVTTFLFYSGYGIMESIKRKGSLYIETIPQKRVLKIWLNFAIAVCFYTVLMVYYQQHFTVKQFVLSLFAWDTMGNSNWYVFAILALYVIVFITFKSYYSISKKSSVIATFIATFFLVVILMHLRKEAVWCYNTLFCFPTGILYSYLKPRIEKIIQNCNVSYCVSLVFSILVFLMAYFLCDDYSKNWNLFWYQVMSIFFPITIMILSMKIKFKNHILSFLGGSALFSIYILMRIPMIILSKSDMHLSPAVFFLLSVGITIVVASLFTLSTKNIIK